MPKDLTKHSSITQGNDLIVIGGVTGLNNHDEAKSSSLYKLKCKNGTFEWSEMAEAQLKTPRSSFVASLIPF